MFDSEHDVKASDTVLDGGSATSLDGEIKITILGETAYT